MWQFEEQALQIILQHIIPIGPMTIGSQVLDFSQTSSGLSWDDESPAEHSKPPATIPEQQQVPAELASTSEASITYIPRVDKPGMKPDAVIRFNLPD